MNTRNHIIEFQDITIIEMNHFYSGGDTYAFNGDADLPPVFEVREDVVAYPHPNRFNVYTVYDINPEDESAENVIGIIV